MDINCLKGTKDIFGPEIENWQRLEQISREIFRLYSYQEIRTPIIENTSLFARSIGKATDIVQKEMYSFKDKGDRDISLRPEETASVVRAYIQHGFYRQKGTAKFYYIGPMFRSERPQAGRMRQFHQIGVEAIGSENPFLDAEIILLLNEILKKSGVKKYEFKVNSLGCAEDRKKYRDVLKKSVEPDFEKLCLDCKKRYDVNILRILDCKNETCRQICSKLPVITDCLCARCENHFAEVLKMLDTFNLPKKVDTHLVRGLDYYTSTAFEVTAQGLGAQDAVAAGGRYDNLVAELGGPKTGACGFAIGMERLISIMPEVEKADKKKNPFVYLIYFDKVVHQHAFKIMSILRENGICADIDYLQNSVKSQMRQANSANADYVIIIGEDEVKNGVLTIKNMKSSAQEQVPQNKLLDFFKNE
ncbi:MAG: histidine--tRNA ligase [Candidatus Omnitrophota bacterium]